MSWSAVVKHGLWKVCVLSMRHGLLFHMRNHGNFIHGFIKSHHRMLPHLILRRLHTRLPLRWIATLISGCGGVGHLCSLRSECLRLWLEKRSTIRSHWNAKRMMSYSWCQYGMVANDLLSLLSWVLWIHLLLIVEVLLKNACLFINHRFILRRMLWFIKPFCLFSRDHYIPRWVLIISRNSSCSGRLNWNCLDWSRCTHYLYRLMYSWFLLGFALWACFSCQLFGFCFECDFDDRTFVQAKAFPERDLFIILLLLWVLSLLRKGSVFLN